LAKPYAESRQASPAKPWTGTHRETEERKPCLTQKRTLQAELKTISMTGEEENRAAKDGERWKLVVRALCSRGNDEE